MTEREEFEKYVFMRTPKFKLMFDGRYSYCLTSSCYGCELEMYCETQSIGLIDNFYPTVSKEFIVEHYPEELI